MAQSKLPSFLLATWFLGTIATKSRVNEFLQSLPEYEIVYPRVISNGNTRDKRSTRDRETLHDDHGEPLFLEISNWTLRTVANDRLVLSSNFTVHWVYSSETKSDGPSRKARCDHRQGSLEDNPRSLVVVTLCKEEVYALMLIDQRSFLVQPLTDGQHVMYQSEHVKWWSTREDPDIVSVSRGNFEENFTIEIGEKNKRSRRKKRSSLSYNAQQFYNLSGDVFDVEYPEAEKLILYDEQDEVSTEYNDTIVEELSIDVNSEEIGYFSGPSWQRNKVSSNLKSVQNEASRMRL